MERADKLRPFYLAKILYERTDEEHSLSTSELQEILEKEYGVRAHRQTIPADVEILRDFGMDIQEVLSSRKQYNLVSREFDLPEIKLLIDAVESSRFITRRKSEELVAKLSGLTGANQAEKLKRHISVEKRIKYDNESIYLIIDGINEAISAGKKISFLYFRYDEHKEPVLRHAGEPFVFSPHELVWNGEFYYVVGVFESGNVGTFRLDRMLKRPEMLEEDVLPLPEDFDFSVYLQASFRMFGVSHRAVELTCTNDVMDAILDKFGKETEAECCDEEHFRVRVEVVPGSVFYSWIFGFGGKVAITEPAEICAEYREMVMKAAQALKE